MKFTPHCVVSYKGDFYKANMAFDIDEQDVDSMKAYGDVEINNKETMQDSNSQHERSESGNDNQTVKEEKQQAKKAGRPRKIEQ